MSRKCVGQGKVKSSMVALFPQREPLMAKVSCEDYNVTIARLQLKSWSRFQPRF